jgi:hypothetical protein
MGTGRHESVEKSDLGITLGRLGFRLFPGRTCQRLDKPHCLLHRDGDRELLVLRRKHERGPPEYDFLRQLLDLQLSGDCDDHQLGPDRVRSKMGPASAGCPARPRYSLATGRRSADHDPTTSSETA